MYKKPPEAKNIIMNIDFANIEDSEIYFKTPAELDVRPIDDKIFKDGIKEILSVEYD